MQYGIPQNPDHNGSRLHGVGLAQFTISDGRRSSAAVAFLAPVLDSDRLEVRSRVTARRLMFDDERCVGVEVEHQGEHNVLLADAKVVVCAGAIESPKLLLLSGIGDPRQLQEVGLSPRVALPGVGANLHDHTVTPLIYACERPLPPASAGCTQHQAHLFWWSRDGYPAPDLQPVLFNVPLYPDGVTGPANAFTLFPGHVRPASRGTVRLTSADPNSSPAIDPGYLTCRADLDALLAGVRLCRQIAAQPAIGHWGAREIFPGPDVATDEDLRRYTRQNVLTYHHTVGTCKMGIDDLAVVDPELRVYGTSGLRVADASIMPAVTTGNTMAPTNMIGERAADLIASSLRGAKPQPTAL